MYCSRQCQTIAWDAGHRDTCKRQRGLIEGSDGTLLQPSLGSQEHQELRLGRKLNWWLDQWRPVLHTSQMFALDLANYPDRGSSHYVEIKLQENGEPEHGRLRDFDLVSGTLVPLHDLHTVDPDVSREVERASTRDGVACTLHVLVEGLHGNCLASRVMQPAVLNADVWRDMDKAKSAQAGASWTAWLARAIANMEPNQVVGAAKWLLETSWSGRAEPGGSDGLGAYGQSES